MNVREYTEKLAAELIAHHDRIQAIVKELPDDEVRELVAACRRSAQPDETHNFAMPEWDLVAEQLEAELGIRRIFRRADEHLAATGSTHYCVQCDGECTPEHQAEFSDDGANGG